MSVEDVDNDVTHLKPELQDLVAKIKQNIIIYNNLPMKVFETARTPERQKWLFDNGYSKTLNSNHLTGSAVDIVYYLDGNWSWDNKIIYYFNFLGAKVKDLYGDQLTWGGEWAWKDLAHYELK
jgi:peptidoglycan L-alanyl-D-glutamate endopeptidase CwlK